MAIEFIERKIKYQEDNEINIGLTLSTPHDFWSSIKECGSIRVKVVFILSSLTNAGNITHQCLVAV